MSSLSPPMLFRLDLACKPIAEAFGREPYLVGSVQNRTSTATSDVDVRLMLPDEQYDAIMISAEVRTMMDLAFTAFLKDLTGLPIDFQFQRTSDANVKHRGQRNPLGGRSLGSWIGDSALSNVDKLVEAYTKAKPKQAKRIMKLAMSDTEKGE